MKRHAPVPCPRCGAQPVVALYFDLYRRQCTPCTLYGPCHETMRDAREAWAAHVSKPAQPVEVEP